MEQLSALSVFLGALSSLLLLSMRLLPRRWARMFADAGREKGRPAWSWATIILCILGAALLWYLHFASDGRYSLAIAILGTFLLARTAQALISKGGLREGSRAFLREGGSALPLPYAIVAIALVVLGLL